MFYFFSTVRAELKTLDTLQAIVAITLYWVRATLVTTHN